MIKINSVAKIGDTLHFVGVDDKGTIKIGLLPLNKVGKQKPEWFEALLQL